MLPLKIHFYGITPGKYRIHGYWDKKDDQPYEIRENFWKRKGQYAIVNIAIVDLKKGESVDAPVSFVKITMSNTSDS